MSDITDPLQFLLAVMRDPTGVSARRIRAAIAVLPYLYAKALPVSPEKPTSPEKAATAPVAKIARFRPSEPPRLQ